MPILRNLIFKAAQRIATDERVQQKAAETYEATKPRIDKTRDDLKKIAQETKPTEEPALFAGRAARRIFDELTGEKPKK
jgi:hypothetical protein